MLQDVDLSAERRNISRIGLILFTMLISTVLLQFAAGTLMSKALSGSGAWVYYALMLLPNYIIVMPLAVLALRLIPSTSISPRSIRPGRLAVVFMICYFIMTAGSLASRLISLIIGLISQSGMSNIVEEMIVGSDLWANLVMVVVLAPVVEEFFYRKILIERLSRYGERVAVIVSGLVFGLIHGNISQFFYAFGLGLAFGYIFVKTGKLRYSIILHITINLLGGIIAPAIINKNDLLLTMLYGAGALSIAVAGLVLFCVNKKRINYEQGECMLPKEKWKSTVFLNTGMILFFVACAGLFAFSTYSSLL